MLLEHAAKLFYLSALGFLKTFQIMMNLFVLVIFGMNVKNESCSLKSINISTLVTLIQIIFHAVKTIFFWWNRSKIKRAAAFLSILFVHLLCLTLLYYCTGKLCSVLCVIVLYNLSQTCPRRVLKSKGSLEPVRAHPYSLQELYQPMKTLNLEIYTFSFITSFYFLVDLSFETTLPWCRRWWWVWQSFRKDGKWFGKTSRKDTFL